MLFEDSSVEQLLRGLVKRFTLIPSLQEDLSQEALVCLWRLEQERPGQRRAWYLQGCRLHLQNYLRSGRSVDSVKRGYGLGVQFAETDDSDNELLDNNVSFLEEICAHDLVEILSAQLSASGRKVLQFLAEGLSDREIARHLNISHTAVRKWRRKIAGLALACDGAHAKAASHSSPGLTLAGCLA